MLQYKEYINKLSPDGIDYLLSYSKNPDDIINKLISTEGFINKMSSIDIRNLLSNSNNPVDIINMLGEKGKEYINNLPKYYLYSFSNYYLLLIPRKVDLILIKDTLYHFY